VVGSIPGNPIFFATRYILHGTVPWRVFLFGWARCAQRAFSSVLGALAVFVSFICSFILFEIHCAIFFPLRARAQQP
jgi:hypothetical protein